MQSLLSYFTKVASFCALLGVIGAVEYVIILYISGVQLTTSDKVVAIRSVSSKTDSHKSFRRWLALETQVKRLHAERNSDREVSMDDNRTIKRPQVIIKPLQRTSKPLQNNHVKCKATEPLVECLKRPARNLTRAEESGDDILFSLRTTVKLHKKRLPVLFKTWLSTVNLSNVFLVTDGKDANLEQEIASTVSDCAPQSKSLSYANESSFKGPGVHHVLSQPGYKRLCYKAGDEMALLFKAQNEHYNWFCHVDDDIYVNLKVLVQTLAKFYPRKEPIYLGRSGSSWRHPRQVKRSTKLGKPGQRYHFAVGGMYCLSRAMLERAKPYLVGSEAFGNSCTRTMEPEDVTIGIIIEVLLKKHLRRTNLIHTHGLHLPREVNPLTLKDQIAFAYGYGAVKWANHINVITVPDAKFSLREDPTRFKSLHCHLHPEVDWCAKNRH